MNDAKINLWGQDGIFAQHFPGYEPRPQQRELFQAVTTAVGRNRHLIAEAGTGTGKSLAYLTPAIVAAYRQPEIKVAISTATINLQEQLVNRDIPAVVHALEAAGLAPAGELTWSALKGKSNYLCQEQLLAFDQEHGDSPWLAANSLLDKISRWQTDTGDRAEISLRPDENWPWMLMSARGANNCYLYRSGAEECYLHRARQKANRSHIVVVNHALLLSDIAANNPYLGHITHIIIDEAHHLEAEASRQFGWEFTEAELKRHLNGLEQDPTLAGVTADMLREWNDFWGALGDCAPEPDRGQGRNEDSSATISPRLRRTREWESVAAAADTLSQTASAFATALNQEINAAKDMGHTPREALLRPVHTAVADTMKQIKDLAGGHDPEQVQWFQFTADRATSVHAIPLRVGPILKEKLFDRRKSVILTSATLTTEPGDFTLLSEQVGNPDVKTLALASPFDYTRQTRLMSPADMPNPKNYRAFGDATAQSLTNIAIKLEGHTLALFTSHAAIRQAAQRIRVELNQAGIVTMAQGIDGAPADIITRYRANPRAIILGANSFWEGVDLSEDLLRAVVICRLPFPVPTDPVIEARSKLFDRPFNDYHIPMAILRFRQGFGRLIRNHRSRGSVIILDPRIRNPGYGLQFFASLPECDYAKSTIDNIGELARQWLEQQ